MSLEGWRAPTGIVARGIGLRWYGRNEGIKGALTSVLPPHGRTGGQEEASLLVTANQKNRLDESSQSNHGKTP